MRVVCYYRHSTDNAAQDANSVPRQRRECRRFAARMNWTIVEEVEDKGESGAGDKANLMDLAQRAKSGEIEFDVLLVDDQARVTRKNALRILEDIEWLDAANVKISCVADNDTEPQTVDDWACDPARLMKAWSNNKYVMEAGRKSASGMLAAHEDGRLSWVGPTPFAMEKIEGKRPDGAKCNGKPFMVLRATDEIHIVSKIFTKFIGGESLRSLVTVLETSKRYKTRPANSTTVKHILKNPIYCGLWAFGMRNVGKWATVNPNKPKRNFYGNVLKDCASVIEYEVEKAVSKEIFLQAQKMLDDNSLRSRGAPAKRDYRYTGLLTCSKCGGAILAHKRDHKGEEIVDYACAAASQSGKKCRNHPKPWSKRFNDTELDKLLRCAFAESISCNASFHWNLIEALADDIKDNSDVAQAGFREELAELEIKELEIKKAWQSLGEFPDWLVKEQREVTSRKQEIEAKTKSGITLSTAVEQKRDEWISGDGQDETGRYCSLIWDVACDYVNDDMSWTNEQKTTKIEKLIGDWVYQIPDGERLHLAVTKDDEICGFSVVDPDGLMRILKDMGLRQIGVDWALASRRGRDKWMLEGLKLEFSWPDSITAMPSTLRDSSPQST